MYVELLKLSDSLSLVFERQTRYYRQPNEKLNNSYYLREMRNLKTLIINSAPAKDLEFVNPIACLCKQKAIDYEISHWKEFAGIEKPPPYDAVIISASPMGDNANFDERITAFQWLKYTESKVLGICAGHQFMGVVFGSRLHANMEAEKGLRNVRIQSRDPIFRGYDDEMEVMQQHVDSISLPDNFTLLARSDKCRVQAIRHNEKPLYGVQWHAEISSLKLISNFLTLNL